MKLLLVEDQVLVRETIRMACEATLGHEVVGECGSGADAIALVRDLSPDAVVLDLALPDFDGLVVVDRLRRAGLFPRVLILSCHCDDYTLFRVERAGVQAFVDKNANTTAELGEALASVVAGRCYYSETFKAVREARCKNPISFTKVLSAWELENLALIGLGLSNREIGARLKISHRTAQTHRSNILRKLKLTGTPKLIRFAVDNGFTALVANQRSFRASA